MWMEHRFIFAPTRGGVGASPGSDVWLKTEDGVALHAWYLSQPNVTRSLLYLHGNAGSLEHRRAILPQLCELGLNVLALDYRGYGMSQGTPSEQGLYADARAAYRWLLDRGEANEIFIYGESLGGGPACELAAAVPCGGLILQSTFTTMPELAMLAVPWLPARLLLRSRFDNLAKITRVSAAKLVIHGRLDDVVPFAMGERLFAAALQPKQALWLEAAAHDDVFDVEADCLLRGVERFVTAGGG